MKKIGITVLHFLVLQGAMAQEITKQDYVRATSFMAQNLIDRKVFNLVIRPEWFTDSSGFSFQTQGPEGVVYNGFDYVTGKTSPLLDQDRLAKILSDSTHRLLTPNHLQLSSVVRLDKKRISFSLNGNQYMLQTDNYSLSQDTSRHAEDALSARSPDGKWIAYCDHYNLYLRSTETGQIRQLSTEGKKNYEYASYYGWGDIMEGENGERPARFAVSWSPDSKWIQTSICDLSKGQKMYLLDWSVDSLYRARLLSYYRASPGDTNMIYETPVFFDVAAGTELVKMEYRSVQGHEPEFEWSRQSGVLYAENHWRGYQRVDIDRIDLNDGTTENLYTESSSTNIDGFNQQLVEEWGKMVILSERDGWRQIYLLDLGDKSLRRLTNGGFYVSECHVDKKDRLLFFEASGKEPGLNPYYRQLYRLGLEGKAPLRLTPEPAHHDIRLSPDFKYIVDNYSTPGQPTVTVLRDAKKGAVLATLCKADVEALLKMKFPPVQAFTAIARDGITTIYGAIWKPSNFDSSKKYPVIDQSYTGPHTHMFPESFAATIYRDNQSLAELGFIVITIDGMGTAGRSKAFHNVSYKNMGNNLLDHVLAIRQLAQKYFWLDTTRVGIFGHSAGGYDACHALLAFPDFYKVGVASSGDHDFRMEKDSWPEMYMGWPVDSTYNNVSNITMAGNLKGKLLVTHGGIDENVNPSATFKLAEALVRANKPFDMLIFPSQHHGYTHAAYFYFIKKRWNYFVENLLGAKPIWEF